MTDVARFPVGSSVTADLARNALPLPHGAMTTCIVYHTSTPGSTAVNVMM